MRGPALALLDMLDEQMKENDALHQIELACRTYEKGGHIGKYVSKTH